MTRTYLVQTQKFGTLRKAADSIAEARTWARTAFPGERCPVQREGHKAGCVCARCERRRAGE